MSLRPALAVLACLLLLGCQSDAERARELLDGPGAGAGVMARDALIEATTLDPSLRVAWSRLADVHLAASQWVEADAAAQRAIALSDDAVHDHETRERAATALERWADAEREISRGIELGADEAPARTRLGKVQEHLDRPEDAMASYRRAIELDASVVEARLALARILLGRTASAAEDEAWDGDEEIRTEVRGLIEAARTGAQGTALAEEVASLSQDLASLDERASAAATRRVLAERGILGLLGAGGPVESPFGRDDALGNDAGSTLGDLMGDQIGDSFGFGGLGLRGVGEGGGSSEGTIGLGNIGTIGHGGGGGGGVGYGSGAGRMVGGRPVGATVSIAASANGPLQASAVQAVARRQSVRLRYCYEQALQADPSLVGNMRIDATVTPAGTTEGARASGFGDASLATCMSAAIGRAAFPPAQGPTLVTLNVACAVAP